MVGTTQGGAFALATYKIIICCESMYEWNILRCNNIKLKNIKNREQNKTIMYSTVTLGT